jgi:hypothetical protein
VIPVDEWGDEGTWETIADFSDMPGGGVPAKTLLKYFKKTNEQDRKIHPQS